MTITSLPTPPSRTLPSEFSTRTDSFLGALPLFVTEANATAAQMTSESMTVTAALNDAAAATYAAMATIWVSGTTYAIGALVWSPANSLMYRRKVAGAGTTDPSLDPTNWVQFQRTLMEYRGRTSNTQITASDKGALVNITSGTFTQTFAACAALGSGWSCFIKNTGTGDITLDPNGSETIDGLTSFIIYPGESRLIHCDGSSLRSIVLSGFRRKWTSGGSFIVPPGYASLGIKLVSGSAGGGSGARNASGTTKYGGAGGGGGALLAQSISNFTVGGTATITVGAKGSGGAAIGTDTTDGAMGGSGGTSTVSGAGISLSVAGGVGGNGGGTSSPSGSAGGGVAAGIAAGFFKGAVGSTGAEYGGGGTGGYISLGSYGSSGPSIFGGGGGGGGAGYNTSSPTTGVAGGLSTFGGSGGPGGAVATSGGNGTLSVEFGSGGGGGGGASNNGTASGKGGDGQNGWVEIVGVL